MVSASKQKGTGGETELKRRIESFLVATGGTDEEGAARIVERMPASFNYDVRVLSADGWVVEALAGRADRRDWYVTVRLQDFLELWYAGQYPPDLHIEVKRFSRISWHGIFESKFGGKR